MPVGAESIDCAGSAKGPNEAVGEGESVANDNNSERIESTVHLELSIESVDCAKVEELLDHYQNHNQSIVNGSRALYCGLYVDVQKLPWISKHGNSSRIIRFQSLSPSRSICRQIRETRFLRQHLQIVFDPRIHSS